MPRQTRYSVTMTDIDNVPFLGLMRELVDSTTGAVTRAKGGIWVDLSRGDDSLAALAHAAEKALEFAAVCEKAHTALLADLAPKAKAPKPTRKPTQAPPAPAPVSEAVKANRAIAMAATANVGLTKTEVKAAKSETRQAIIDNARAERKALSVAPTPRVSAPKSAPAKIESAIASVDWQNLIG